MHRWCNVMSGINLVTNPYSKFFLTENPFKTHHGFQAGSTIWAGRPNTKRKIEKIIHNVTSENIKQYIIVCGEYGSGKSYTLQYFYAKLQSYPLLDSVLSIYVENPGNSFLDFYRSIIRGIGSNLMKMLTLT